MGTAKTKVRIFSMGLTSIILITVLSAILKSGIVIDYNTIQVMIFAMFTAALVTLASIYAGLVLFVEGLLLKWGIKLLEASEENENDNFPNQP